MRLEKKTMATLLAAILIAMMGVMPALAAESATVGLTVNTLEADVISIFIVGTDPTGPIVLTEKLGAQYPDLVIVHLQSDSTVNIDVTAVMQEGSDAFFTSCLMINGGVPDGWPGLVGTNMAHNIPFDVSLGLDLSDETVTGTYVGTLVFWAVMN